MSRLRDFLTISLLLTGILFAFLHAQTPKDTLIVELTEKVHTLDPALARDQISKKQVGYTYEGPTLEIGPDERTLIFRIKKGTYFQDDPCFARSQGKGREATADDLIFSIKRLADPRINMNWGNLRNKIVGLDQFREEAMRSPETDYSKIVSGLDAKDRYTLFVHLNQSAKSTLPLFAEPQFSAVAREAVEFYKEQFFKNPVGTGPYILDREHSSFAERMVWKKNPTWHASSKL